MLKFETVKKLALVFALALPLGAQAGLRVLDFDYDAQGNKINDGQIIDDEYQDWGVTISSCNFSGAPDTHTDQINGVCAGHDRTQRQSAFDTSNTHTPDPDLEFVENNGEYFSLQSGSKFDPLSSAENYYNNLFANGTSYERDTWKRPGNVLIINEERVDCDGRQCEGPNDEGARPAGFFVFEFAQAVDILSLDFFDIEVAEAQRTEPDAKIFFFLADNSVKERQVPGLGNANYARVDYTGLFNVTKIVLNMPGSGAINNLVYKHSEVSAPSALAFILLIISTMVYRRKSA